MHILNTGTSQSQISARISFLICPNPDYIAPNGGVYHRTGRFIIDAIQEIFNFKAMKLQGDAMDLHNKGQWLRRKAEEKWGDQDKEGSLVVFGKIHQFDNEARSLYRKGELLEERAEELQGVKTIKDRIGFVVRHSTGEVITRQVIHPSEDYASKYQERVEPQLERGKWSFDAPSDNSRSKELAERLENQELNSPTKPVFGKEIPIQE